MEEISEAFKVEIPPTMLGRIVKEKYGDEVLTTKKFKMEYGKCIKAFVHFLTSMASEDCQEHGRVKVTPANLKSVLNDFNLEFLYAGIDIKDSPPKKASKPKTGSELKRNYSKVKKNSESVIFDHTRKITDSTQEKNDTLISDLNQMQTGTSDQMLIEEDNH